MIDIDRLFFIENLDENVSEIFFLQNGLYKTKGKIKTKPNITMYKNHLGQ